MFYQIWVCSTASHYSLFKWQVKILHPFHAPATCFIEAAVDYFGRLLLYSAAEWMLRFFKDIQLLFTAQ